jgi:uncharacterized protein
MAIDLTRRALLIAATGAAVAAVAWRRGAESVLLMACDDSNGQHYLAAVDADGKLRFQIPVAERAHDIAMLPDGHTAIYFGRRPATVSYIVDLDAGELIRTLHSPGGRHFYGHGVVHPDGLLYTSENDYATARGVIAVWDTTDGFRRVGELESGGTGPHDLAFLSDGKTIVVANGGIETHPDRPREKLNIPQMQPSLAYVDAASGDLLARYLPDDSQMSLRHLAVTSDDRVVVGVQYEGDDTAVVPLLLRHNGEDRLQAAVADPAVWRSHRNYIASVAATADGRYAVLTAPRGDTASLWDLQSMSLAGQWRIRDVAGIASNDSGEILLSNGFGELFSAGPQRSSPHRTSHHPARWDNHLLAV